MTAQSVSQAGVEVLFRATPGVQVGQAGAEYAHRVTPGALVSQAGIEYLHRVIPQFAISQAGSEYLFKAVPCTTHWTQVWTIRRTDGTELRFTALDRDLVHRGETFRSCNSMDPTASENVGSVDEAGNMDLSGLLADGSVTEADLHAGLYDGATVEAMLVSWKGPALQKPLLKGTFGPVTYSETGFRVELLGDGARLQQEPLVHAMQPNCRYQFGDDQCGSDIEAVRVSGTVTASAGQRGFTDDTRAETAGYFRRGTVTFTSGANAGASAEIKEHLDGGGITLWPRLGFAIEVGDTYTMTPGCTNTPDGSGGCNGCKDWGNYVNFGGEPSLKGNDQLRRQPDVKK